METDRHTEGVHKERLNCLCRVCGGRSKKRYSEASLRYCNYVESELRKYHHINILRDSSDSHSKTMCSMCFSRIYTLKRSENVTTLQNAKADSDYASDLWIRFDPSVSLSECRVCAHFASQSKAGRPIRRKRGRPNQADTLSGSTESSTDTNTSNSDTSFLPLLSSTPDKVPRMQDMHTSPIKLHTPEKAHTSVQPKHTPKRCADMATSINQIQKQQGLRSKMSLHDIIYALHERLKKQNTSIFTTHKWPKMILKFIDKATVSCMQNKRSASCPEKSGEAT